MAGPTLCVSCAQLPVKAGSLAVKKMRCPECQAECGVTSYGAAFRVAPSNRHVLLNPMVLLGATFVTGIFAFAVVLAALGMWSREQMISPPRPVDPPPGHELAMVPEVAVAEAFPSGIRPDEGKRRISGLIAKIRNTNGPGNKDAFVLANMQDRPELRGLPFVMGDACRLDVGRAQSFQTSVQAVRDGLDSDFHQRGNAGNHSAEHAAFWQTYLVVTQQQGIDTDHGVAALTQILGPERQSLRYSMVQRLARSARTEATRVLARSAVFDASADNRIAAIKAIKERKSNEDAAIINETLMHGIRYPLAIMSKRAAQAIVMLDRKELMPQLVDSLADPAPGDPTPAPLAPGGRGDGGEGVCVVREVVRINHHRNCLLCHPPSQTGQDQEVPGVIPIPGQSFPTSPKEAYGKAQSFGEPMVRADTTYLRQDFSVLMPVANAAPWPELQRFDFLVRTRVVEGAELAAIKERVKVRPAGFQSDNHKAAIYALAELTGQRDVAPNQAAWRKAIGQ